MALRERKVPSSLRTFRTFSWNFDGGAA